MLSRRHHSTHHARHTFFESHSQVAVSFGDAGVGAQHSVVRLPASSLHGAGSLRPPGPFVAPLVPRCALTSAPSPRDGPMRDSTAGGTPQPDGPSALGAL